MYKKIKDLREDNDKLQKEIAIDLKTNVTQYQRYENGKREPPFNFIISLANYYNVSLDYIAGRTNDKKGFNKSDLPDSEVDLLKKFRSLSEQQRGIIIGRIEAMTEENEEKQAQIKDVV
ncbi:MAG: helix-turn-helix transcriptional regulator [Oscillospiraceae bacterium]|nr:helix-turn-helix transcriptional regulator [Oscillospiraceae bacterium]